MVLRPPKASLDLPTYPLITSKLVIKTYTCKTYNAVVRFNPPRARHLPESAENSGCGMGVAMAAAALASAATGMTVAAPRKAMAYNKLGTSDLMVSSCCLGTRASSKCPSPQQPVRPPAAPEARPFAPWNPRGGPRHVGVLWCPPNSPVSPPLGSTRVWRLRLLGARLAALGGQ